MLTIDLNCDMGEGFPDDEAIMPYISSVNIACGYHAGDISTMHRTVELAIKNNVAIGAHPSYPDKENFGRIDIMYDKLKPEDLPDIIIDQLVQLRQICSESGIKLHHVKPHGALYNRAAWDDTVSGFIFSAIKEFDPSLLLYGLSGSKMKTEADAYDIRFINEVFADRTYQDDGSLTPRNQRNALIENEEKALQQILKMIQTGKVTSVNDVEVSIIAETICIHGDGSRAAAFAKHIHHALKENGIEIRSI